MRRKEKKEDEDEEDLDLGECTLLLSFHVILTFRVFLFVL